LTFELVVAKTNAICESKCPYFYPAHMTLIVGFPFLYQQMLLSAPTGHTTYHGRWCQTPVLLTILCAIFCQRLPNILQTS